LRITEPCKRITAIHEAHILLACRKNGNLPVTPAFKHETKAHRSPVIYVDVLGYVAGILVVISLLPQAVKSWRTRSTRDISLLRYVVYATGLVLWIVYAALIRNGPVAVMNSIGLILALFILSCKIRFG